MNLIRQWCSEIVLLWGWRANLASFLLGFVLALGLPPFDIWPIAFVCFPIFVLLLDGAARYDLDVGLKTKFKLGFVKGWLFGLGYFLASLWWVATSFLVDGGIYLFILPFAMLALPMGLAIFTGLACGIAMLNWHSGATRIMSLAGLLAASEYFRGTIMTGFPWNPLGMPAMAHPIGMQSASALGIFGVSLLAIFVFCAPVLAIQPVREGSALLPSNKPKIIVSALAILLAMSHLGFGVWRIASTNIEAQPNLAMRIVQPNIPQNEKWLPQLQKQHFDTYLELSNLATSPQTIGAVSFSHIIWPETALTFLLTEEAQAIGRLDELLAPETTLLTGAVRAERPIDEAGQQKVYNTLYAINGSGQILDAQDKLRLVPFGEFLPFTGILDKLGLAPRAMQAFGFTHGAERKPMKLHATPSFLPLICYEIIFQPDFEAEQPNWLLNVTNDAWFGNTPGPYQHLRHAQLRAVSQGVPVVRAANTGISAFIDPLGRIVQKLPLGEKGVLDGGLPNSLGISSIFWHRTGVFWTLVLLFLLAGSVPKFIRTKK